MTPELQAAIAILHAAGKHEEAHALAQKYSDQSQLDEEGKPRILDSQRQEY